MVSIVHSTNVMAVWQMTGFVHESSVLRVSGFDSSRAQLMNFSHPEWL